MIRGGLEGFRRAEGTWESLGPGGPGGLESVRTRRGSGFGELYKAQKGLIGDGGVWSKRTRGMGGGLWTWGGGLWTWGESMDMRGGLEGWGNPSG